MAIAALAVLIATSFAGTAAASPGLTLGATYAATVPVTATAGATITVPVTVANTGSEPWPSAGATPVNLSYHWLAADGTTAVWEGLRTPLGADLAPGASRSLTAIVAVPAAAGAYQLKFHLVREGVAWFPSQSAPSPVQAQAAYVARFAAPVVAAQLTGTTFTAQLAITNTGAAAWNAAGANPIDLSYHWHDLAGNTVVWDGVRTPLAADVLPGATVTLNARVTAPATPGSYTLTFDLVREGVNWFQFLGSTPVRVSAVVQPATFAARYDVLPALAATFAETQTVTVTVTNTGNVTWPAAGANPVSVSYHIFDSAGRTVVWDGMRTPLGTDLAPGASRTLQLAYVAPRTLGAYSLNVDAVREGVSWFSGYGVPAGGIALNVTSGFSAGFGATTTPPQAAIGAAVDLAVDVVNYGPRTLLAGGANPIRLSYHIRTASGGVVVWDGLRGTLPRDLPPGTSATVPIRVQLPSATGSYTLAWDLVQEGVAWLSALGVQSKVEPVSVIPGVTFYGKGFGHGVGMSQFGAQGWATGAYGAALTGEQIIQKYYTGTQITEIPTSSGNRGIRVLLSVPSSTGQWSCGMPALNTSSVDISGWGTYSILDEGRANAVISTGQDREALRVSAVGAGVRVMKPLTGATIYEGAGPVVFVANPIGSMQLAQKGTYRGNTKFTNAGGALRVINFVNYDDYVKGVVRKEMFANWNVEAYKAQAYAAKAYAYTSYKGGAADYDVRDDQLDQCYGGVGAEEPLSNQAVEATRGRIPTFNGEVIRAYFSSSSGGYTVAEGCWTNLAQSGGRWACGSSRAYLTPVEDPADLRVSVPTANKHASWQVTFTSEQIRQAVLNNRGVDIGTLMSIDLSNTVPVGSGHVVSLVVRGSNATVDLRADTFLRTNLGMKSTMIRLAPW